jgi:hypothetical protein
MNIRVEVTYYCGHKKTQKVGQYETSKGKIQRASEINCPDCVRDVKARKGTVLS